MAVKSTTVEKEVKTVVAKAEEVKKDVVKEEAKKETTEKKAPAKKETAKKETVKKETTEKKAPAKKTAAKKEEVKKETAEKKAPAKKAPAKKAVEKTSLSIHVQFADRDYTEGYIRESCVNAYLNETGKKSSSIKKIEIYVKPADYAAYYVVNDDYAGRIDL